MPERMEKLDLMEDLILSRLESEGYESIIEKARSMRMVRAIRVQLGFSISRRIRSFSTVRKGMTPEERKSYAAGGGDPSVAPGESAGQQGDSFGKGYRINGSGVVVLQNRNRKRFASINQMNKIASNPKYTLMSFSRVTSTGAPIVSFGSAPDKEHSGLRDFVEDNGERIPVWYAVVEAEEIVASNYADGSVNRNYPDPHKLCAIAGNGRVAGIVEAYRRGSAETYRDELMADYRVHGVPPEIIAEMEHPVLVRVVMPDKVTTGFVSRSNSDQVLARGHSEIAVEDAELVGEKIENYEFDDDGIPSAETVRQFCQDIDEPNALGVLLNDDGEPTPDAANRIKYAVFQEAYRSAALTGAYTNTARGMIRVYNGMSKVAPKVVAIRKRSRGKIDLSKPMVKAAEEIKAAKARNDGTSEIGMSRSLDGVNDPVEIAFRNLFAVYRNSAAGIARAINAAFNFVAEVEEINAQSAGEGLFGGDEIEYGYAEIVAAIYKSINEDLKRQGIKAFSENPDDYRKEIADYQEQAKTRVYDSVRVVTRAR